MRTVSPKLLRYRFMAGTGLELALAALDYESVPFRHLGRDLKGVDCIGLLVCSARAVGCVARDFDYTNYSRTPNGHDLVRELLRVGLKRHGGRIRAGMFGSFRLGREPMHMGIFCGTDRRRQLIHADAGVGKVVRHTFDMAWRRRLTSVWIWPDLQY